MINTDKKLVDMKSLQEHLIKNGINPSFQRLKILEYLMNNDTHPTVDNIYNALIDIIPTISKTTIYNTLKLFSLSTVSLAYALASRYAMSRSSS